ncbi:MAG: hypothetical protein J1F67_08355 [Muribaculaceae bacterium]|nr:hypothetical protein [Muribaculaceae bacterium]
MKKINKYICCLSAFILALSLWSCKEDSVDNSVTEDYDKVAVSFLIPENGPSFNYDATRANDTELENSYLNNGEGNISNLYIVAVQLSYFNYLSKDDPTLGDNIQTDKSGNKYIEQDMSSQGTSGRQRVVINPINVYDFDGIINKEKSYNLTLYPGRYRFYAFANCDLYVNNLYEAEGIYTEDYIKQLALYYTSDVPLKVAHLPMSCTPERIVYDNVDGNNLPVSSSTTDRLNNTVPIYKNTQANIHVNLKFMCSKVRYTILFDATQPTEKNNYYEGISSGFGNQSIRFYVDEMGENRPVATYLRKRTFLYTDLDDDKGRLDADKNDPFILNPSTSTELPSDGYFGFTRDDIDTKVISYANWPVPLNRYVWPEIGDKYPLRPMDVLDLYTGTLDEWKALRQRAWQGVVYLPENQDDGIEKTEIHFPFVLDTYAQNIGTEDEIPYTDGEVTGEYKTLKLFGNSSETQYEGKEGQTYKDEYDEELQRKDYSSGLERGVFYDVVARVINPDKWDLKIIVYAKVEEWHDMEQNLTEDNQTIIDGNHDIESNSNSISGQVDNWSDGGSYNW